MPTIRVIDGTGRHCDPWHPFHETTPAIAATLTEAGYRVDVRDAEPDAISDLRGVDLLVVNAGGGTDPRNPLPTPPEWAAAYGKLGDWLDTHPVLAVHTGINAFRDWDRWFEICGGTWVPGVSGHPERSLAVFEPMPGAEGHPILAGLDRVIAYDERYWKIDIHAGIAPVLMHETFDVLYPVVWVTPSGRAIYDALGHMGRTYESPERRRLLTNEVAYLLS